MDFKEKGARGYVHDDGPVLVSGVSSTLGSSLAWISVATGAAFGTLLAWGAYLIGSSANADAVTINAPKEEK